MFFYNILDMLELINSLSSNYYYILIISLKDTIFGFSIKYFPFIYMIISLPGIYIISILNLITINIIISIYER